MTTWTPKEAGALADRVDFAKAGGMVAVVVRDLTSREIVMTAWQDREAFERSLTTGLMHYHSRSRGALWRKGETSGHVQEVARVWLDCDGDALLFDVHQRGPGACHTGHFSCFHRRATSDGWEVVGEPAFDANEVYSASSKT